jgi:hypothetical protein
MGHVGAYALERIAESKALARASARRAEKQAHRRIAGDPGRAATGYSDGVFGRPPGLRCAPAWSSLR